jgi:hypothetical protein
MTDKSNRRKSNRSKRKTTRRGTSKRQTSRRNKILRGGLTGVTEEQLRTIAQDRYNQKQEERLHKIREYNAGLDNLLERETGKQIEGQGALATLFSS